MNRLTGILFLSIVLISATNHPGASAFDVVEINGRLVDSWAYQLQGRNGADLDLTGLAGFEADLVVIDYSRNGGEDGEFSPAEIDVLAVDDHTGLTGGLVQPIIGGGATGFS